MANNTTVTFSGRSMLLGKYRGSSVTEAVNLKWGTSGGFTGAANGDVALFAPATETGIAGTASVITTAQLGDTYKLTGTMTCLVAPKVITEVALSDTTTLAPTTTVAVSLTNVALSVSLGAASGIAAGNYYRQIGSEVVLVTGGQNTALETITRAQLGSTAVGAPISTPTTIGGDGGAHANFTLGGQTATIAAANGGNQFLHGDFSALSLSINDAIAFTITDQFT